MVIDQATRKTMPNVASMFLKPGYPASACFDGTNIPRDLIQKSKVHINAPESVALTEDKVKLYKKLDNMGYPVPKYMPFDNAVKNGVFDISKFDETFGELPYNLLQDGTEVEISDTLDLLSSMGFFKDQKAVAHQSHLTDTTRAYAQVIPNAAGKSLARGVQIVKNGVLSTNIPGSEITLPFLGMVRDLVDEMGLDYARVELAFDSKGNFEILDVNTKLKQADIPSIRQYMDMLAAGRPQERKKLIAKR